MLVLFECAAGFALFKVLDEGKLKDVDDLQKAFETEAGAKKMVKLKAFKKFENTADALASAAALVDSKMSKTLKKFLKKHVVDETLALADSKLGSVVKEKLDIQCIYSSQVMELLRGVRAHLEELLGGISAADLAPMSLGLSHSLSRYKLKFSPDKVDTMIIQAIGLLDDLDKELNTYGWHFPEMTKIVADNIQYAKVVLAMGLREAAAELDLSDVLAEEVEGELKEAAVVSMGTEISADDLANIQALADQVVALSEYRATLFDYLKSRMAAIAPNLTVLVGELVGARLIAHAGSLLNLAKHPASTVQILGAEKALFRALKTKHETPKYGLIYHASLIGQSAPKFKGKISRVLAAKCALSIRVDALGETSEATIGLENREKVEARLRQLEGRATNRAAGVGKGAGGGQPKKLDGARGGGTPALLSAPKGYNADADVVAAPSEKKKKKQAAAEEAEDEEAPKPKKKKRRDEAEEEDGEAKPQKKKKKKAAAEEDDE